jgi:peptide/nickel transport system ATP-binding protein
MTTSTIDTNREGIPLGRKILEAQGLNVRFAAADGGWHHVVKNVEFSLREHECLALVGESGSGKSVTARSLVGLVGENSQVQAEKLELLGDSLLNQTGSWWRSVRGVKIGFILQDALVSLDPLRPVGKEIAEPLAIRHLGNRQSRTQLVVEGLTKVGVPEAALRARQRSGELSGGLRQRALIASALALDPGIVIADEPTTALDVTVQAQVLSVLRELLNRGKSVILISHDLAVVAQMADTILVMQGGQIVESGPAAEVLSCPSHPYTRQLIAAVPSEHTRGTRLTVGSEPPPPIALPQPSDVVTIEGPDLLVGTDIVKRFRRPDKTWMTAVKNVSFRLGRGETLGVVGESGSGKSTLARIALALEIPDSGQVEFKGQAWTSASIHEQQRIRRQISVVYQDPLSSFDPRWKVERILTDAIGLATADAVGNSDEKSVSEARLTGTTRRKGHSGSFRDRAVELLEAVGLTARHLQAHPLHLSGGQRQRVAIARAIAGSPEVVVLDEAVSALDVSVQAQVLDLLSDLQERLGVSYLFISHDLGVIHHMSDRVLVMENGIGVEQGDADDVFYNPTHPYTVKLLEALPRLEYAALRQAVA